MPTPFPAPPPILIGTNHSLPSNLQRSIRAPKAGVPGGGEAELKGAQWQAEGEVRVSVRLIGGALADQGSSIML